MSKTMENKINLLGNFCIENHISMTELQKLVKAREHKHMTMYEAAKIAKEAEVPKLWLTHYSPSMTRPEEFMEDVRKIFPATYAAKDGWTMELKFDEGE